MDKCLVLRRTGRSLLLMEESVRKDMGCGGGVGQGEILSNKKETGIEWLVEMKWGRVERRDTRGMPFTKG